MAVIATLPTMEQLETPYPTDRELSTGALATEIELNGKKVNAGYAFSSVAGGGNSVRIRSYNGGSDAFWAVDGRILVRPRFETVGDPLLRGDRPGTEKKLEIIDGILVINGNPVYWGAEKIDVAEELESIGLELPSDKNRLDWKDSNNPFELQGNKCYKVRLSDGSVDFAEKIVGVKLGNSKGIKYSDGTPVKTGATAYHRLRPMPAKKIYGGIQAGAGMATKFCTQTSYDEMRHHKDGDTLKVADYDVSEALAAMTNAFIKSAEVMATLGKSNTVSGLFDQLLAGAINEDGLREGLKALAKSILEKEDATAEDADKLSTEIEKALAQYKKVILEREKAKRQDGQKRQQVQIALKWVNRKIDQLEI